VAEQGQQLPGGGLGGAIRIGDTVRRAAGPWTPTIHALLAHLNEVGLAGVPRPMGLDELGREVISLIEGDTVYSTRGPLDQGWPAWAFADELLVQAGEWLASYHRAVRSFRPERPRWRSGARDLGPDEIVCHYDFRAANIVVRNVDGAADDHGPRLVGVIDWDTAGPGRPLFDVALAAWNWVPLWDDPDRDDAEVARRLRLLVEAYGTFSPYEVLAAVPDRLEAATDLTRAMAASGDEAMRRLVDRDLGPSRNPLRQRLPRLIKALARHP
jgi:Ser/Thr protein kinase RdoA (MazF antagonist)